MLNRLIRFSVYNPLVIFLGVAALIGVGTFSLLNLSIGAVPDITNNQVQVITTSRNLGTSDVEQFITYPVELAMANLAGVEEIRSISKFGLSVVTVVFEDGMGTYLPRQLIAEKIEDARKNIPAGFGTPEMGPISTGLGEIYQYTLDVEPGYADRYTPSDLRDIQDWNVRRQLSGIPGVVEVNTWGGLLKQYEVTVDPLRLRAMNLTVGEIYTALESNNTVAGGGYIERAGRSYFIRAEGRAANVNDLENIVVTRRNNLPVYVRDVATVSTGSATRFGAITGNGEGEKVLGQVMMLKGESSKAVIDRVRERVATIQPTLPEGVYINPIVDRADLIGRTTNTIAENLLLACLIVIFVVVLLLGNWRGGLIVASVIPLSLLFALTGMYLFGIDANLMSLGAIDFGIIIDGAVIIVEYVVFLLAGKHAMTEKDSIKAISERGATTMMNSAIFGQLIVIVVFLPILTLTGVEGKMFRPMALVFCLALLGAVLLCLTYVPAVSGLFLRPGKIGFMDRFVGGLQGLYVRVMPVFIRARTLVLGLSLVAVVITAWLFSRMGAEFVPTLDEGDFVIQPVLKVGTSLGRTVELTTKMEQILLEFPEVKQVVSRIGAAEIPTDPMSMEESDVIITLHEPSTWTSADSKDELADKFKEALAVLPGIEVEFTQPIEMRFNELITGTRADLAISIFGEDLEELARLGTAVGEVVEGISGAADVSVEKTSGLPQLNVEIDRAAVARYGLNAAEVSEYVAMAFAGKSAGSIYEGERRYDLVVRFAANDRDQEEDLNAIYLPLPTGGQVPLSEVARVISTSGPAMINRDNTRRRVVVSVNVRGRDLESVVDDARAAIGREVTPPPGYLITYGGQFENLNAARDRLLLAVPIALLLIFVLLYFALKNWREVFIVATLIPLALVGGVLLLWLRGMPFSISAGVGFIALFGIAVLNGLVLVEHYKDLRRGGATDRLKIIVEGTRDRIRPVLLTATSTALGFLPMAISTSAGAEVQRPLATVVIGGLITATLLTLIVLPILYYLFGFRRGRGKANLLPLTLIFLFFSSLTLPAQTTLSLPEAQTLARERNPELNALSLEVDRKRQLLDADYEFGRTGAFYNFDQLNGSEIGRTVSRIGANQIFVPFGLNAARRSLASSAVDLASLDLERRERQVAREVAVAYVEVYHLSEVRERYRRIDSLYTTFVVAARRRYEVGEDNRLSYLTVQARQRRIVTELARNEAATNAARAALNRYLVENTDYRLLAPDELELPLPEPSALADQPLVKQLSLTKERIDQQLAIDRRQRQPNLQLEYALGFGGGDRRIYHGFTVGTSLALSRRASRSRTASARIEVDIARQRSEGYRLQLDVETARLEADLAAASAELTYFRNTGAELSAELLRVAARSFETGEVGVFEYLEATEAALLLEIDYLDRLSAYRKTLVALRYFTL